MSEPTKAGGRTGGPVPDDVPKRVGNYEIISKIGEGGMGAVFKARHVELGNFAAVKFLAAGLTTDETFVKRFEREARLAANLTSPYSIRTFDVGEAGGVRFILMDFIEGRSLNDILDERGTLPEEEALSIVYDVAQALQEAHEMGIVHRDIKPENIMITNRGVPKLADLGIAKETKGDKRLTMTGFAVGTPSYMSPEQAQGILDVDTRSDIYSLGATLFRMVVGNMPFDGPTPLSVMHKIATEPAPDPSAVNARLSPAMCALIKKMMSRDRNERFQTVEQIMREIASMRKGEGTLVGRAVSTPPPEAMGRTVLSTETVVRKRKNMFFYVGVPAAAAVLIAAIVGVLLAGGKEKGGKAPAAASGSAAGSPPPPAPQPPPPTPDTPVAPTPLSAPPGQPTPVAVASAPVAAKPPEEKPAEPPKPADTKPVEEKMPPVETAVAPGPPVVESPKPVETPKPVEPPKPPEPPKPVEPPKPPFGSTPTYANSIGMNFVLIPSGKFKMGSPPDEAGRNPSEGPAHDVTISRPFYLSATEVTNAQFESFRPDHKARRVEGAGDGHPVVNVSWNDAVAFCRWLSLKEGKTYRLPTEAEWEYACRAGSAAAYSWGGTFSKSKANAGKDTGIAPAGKFPANAWGLRDMHGNVWEWCADWYAVDYYGKSPSKDPAGPDKGADRVVRGGSAGLSETYARSAFRHRMSPDTLAEVLGFRTLIEIE